MARDDGVVSVAGEAIVEVARTHPRLAVILIMVMTIATGAFVIVKASPSVTFATENGRILEESGPGDLNYNEESTDAKKHRKLEAWHNAIQSAMESELASWMFVQESLRTQQQLAPATSENAVEMTASVLTAAEDMYQDMQDAYKSLESLGVPVLLTEGASALNARMDSIRELCGASDAQRDDAEAARVRLIGMISIYENSVRSAVSTEYARRQKQQEPG